MKKCTTYILGFAIVLFSVWMAWVFVNSLEKADASIKAGLIGMLGMLSGALVVHYLTKKREIDARHFADKRAGYMILIDLIFELLFSIKNGQKLSEKSMQENMIKFKKSLFSVGRTRDYRGMESIRTGGGCEFTFSEFNPRIGQCTKSRTKRFRSQR